MSVNVDTGGGYEAISPEQSFHIGVSIFDARCLVQKLDDPRDAITSYQFINRDSRPCKWAAKSFLFGETELMTLNDFASRISLLTKDRDYVLDTVKAAQFPLQLSYRYSVEKLLDELGNDAHFVLKALLMIAVRDGQMVREPGDEELFRYLAAVAHAPCELPVWTDTPPVTSTSPKSNIKLGIKAKRRLRAERKAARRVVEELPRADESTTQQTKDEQQHKTPIT